jgi:hypothetical protein
VKQSAHDLLSFHNTIFERDFVEFTMNNSALENQIQEFMATSIQNMSSIDKQLQFMSQFAAVLSREALKEDLVCLLLPCFRLCLCLQPPANPCVACCRITSI